MNSTPAPEPSATFILAMRVASARIEELESENRSLRSVIVSLEERLHQTYRAELLQPSVWQRITYGLTFLVVATIYIGGIIWTAALIYAAIKQPSVSQP